MVAPTVHLPSMRVEAAPESRLRRGGYRVRAHSGYTRCAAVLAALAVLEKEVHAPLGPAEMCRAIAQQAPAADALTQVVEDGIKPVQVVNAAHRCTAHPRFLGWHTTFLAKCSNILRFSAAYVTSMFC